MQIIKNFSLLIISGVFFFVLMACDKSSAGDGQKKQEPEAVSSASPLEGKIVNEVREIKLAVNDKGISPRKFYIQVSEKVKINIRSTAGNHRIQFDKLEQEVRVGEGKDVVLEFVAPEKPTKINFRCMEKGHEDKKGYIIAKPRS